MDASRDDALLHAIMAKTDDERTKRLAEALRANLRKRKEGQRAPAPSPDPDEKAGLGE